MASRNKCCFVPSCTSTSISTPNKLFVCVPRDCPRKLQWFKAARRDMPKSQSVFFCCEDHFDLKEDMKNYMRFRLMGGNIILKYNVVPHIFDCQGRKRAAGAIERPAFTKRQRKQLVEEALLASTTAVSVSSASDTNESALNLLSKMVNQSVQTIIIPSTVRRKSIGVQVKPYYRSKYTMYDLKNVVQAASSTTKTAKHDQNTPS